MKQDQARRAGKGAELIHQLRSLRLPVLALLEFMQSNL